MPLHIESLTTVVEYSEEELGLSAEQVEKLVEVLLARVDERDRERGDREEATGLRRGVTPPLPVER